MQEVIKLNSRDGFRIEGHKVKSISKGGIIEFES